MSCHGCPGNIDPLIIVPQNALGPQGPQGIPGPPGPVGPAGLTWQGAWNANTSYVLNDAVGYSGASYFCIAPITGNPSNPAPNTIPGGTNWALLAAQGAQGSQGVQGVQGNPGANGVSAYVYVGFASDTGGANFNTVRNAGGVLRCYMNILTSTAVVSPLTAASFTVTGTVTYVTGWLNLCTDLGSMTKSGNFSSGPSNPLSGTTGDIFLNTSTASFFYYTGTQWIVLNDANPVTNIINITPSGSFTNGARNPQYRQIGPAIKMRGSINTTGTASLVTTDVVLFNLNAGYRPGLTKYSTAFDPYTATWATIKIETNGDVVLLGTKTPVYVDELSLDTTQFELL